MDAGEVVEVPAQCKSGATITVELSLNPVTSKPGDGRLVLAMIRDVSECVEL